jgi:hypothetical protein
MCKQILLKNMRIIHWKKLNGKVKIFFQDQGNYLRTFNNLVATIFDYVQTYKCPARFPTLLLDKHQVLLGLTPIRHFLLMNEDKEEAVPVLVSLSKSGVDLFRFNSSLVLAAMCSDSYLEIFSKVRDQLPKRDDKIQRAIRYYEKMKGSDYFDGTPALNDLLRGKPLNKNGNTVHKLTRFIQSYKPRYTSSFE